MATSTIPSKGLDGWTLLIIFISVFYFAHLSNRRVDMAKEDLKIAETSFVTVEVAGVDSED